MRPNKESIIYILGFARSGSTVLNIILGNIQQVFAAGEINAFVRSGWVADEYCSCGNRVSNCEFWPDVKKSMDRSLTKNPSSIADLTKELENWRILLNKSQLYKNKSKIEKHNNFYTDLYRSIFKTSKARWIIDASKDPIRLNYLLKRKEYNYYAVHIIRDPRGVCWSKMKPLKKDLENGVQKDLKSVHYLSTIKSLYMNTLLVALVKRKIPKKQFIKIKYEDLISQPERFVWEIQRVTGLDCNSLIEQLESASGLSQSHNVAGNRLRMRKKIKLRFDNSWCYEMNFFQRLAVTILTLPLLVHYKYSVLSHGLNPAK